ncbi:6-phosphogluconolactonase [Pikeienuella piscinae]|uniref:6-phosphogluconolactonase n=1 Tax=Pikeienuella piscinae TaxID=2748098 RepID=A0A7L5BZC4_9RHOB|nr:6-phosphogluconolactonase [Pikeienuella piscinae]QIE55234.1 6-phosphogluconolactonase [Pikeienuella piscinae]
MAPLIVHADRDRLAAGLAALVAEDLRAALRAKGRASFAAPGGTTPAAFLSALAAAPLDWARVSVLPGDERWTPPEDERSNEAMIRRAMAAATGARFEPFWRAGETPESAAPLLSAAIAPALPLDVAVIGMGADMHCASLFPGAANLSAALAPDAPPVAAITAPGAVEPRVTLTLPALAGAGRLYLLIAGADKRAALRTALGERDATVAPVGAVLGAARAAEVHWAP